MPSVEGGNRFAEGFNFGGGVVKMGGHPHHTIPQGHLDFTLRQMGVQILGFLVVESDDPGSLVLFR